MWPAWRLLGMGVVVFITEIWRDPEGRGALFGGVLNGPQAAALVLVIAGGLMLLRARKRPRKNHRSSNENSGAQHG